METPRPYLAAPTPPPAFAGAGSGGDGARGALPVPVPADGCGGDGHAVADVLALAERLGAVEAKLDALLSAVTGLRLGGLELLTVREVCDVLKLSRTKVNELIQSGALGMWKLDGERRITRAGLDAYIRRQAQGEAPRQATRRR